MALLLLVGTPACDHGLEPPDKVPLGEIHGVVRYVGAWPPSSEIKDLRFVAMRFVPQDTADFLQLNLMAISDRLAYGVASDTFRIENVEPGLFVYSGVAQQVTDDLLSWRPVGLYAANDGVFDVRSGQSTELVVDVDFAHLPDFPPPPP